MWIRFYIIPLILVAHSKTERFSVLHSPSSLWQNLWRPPCRFQFTCSSWLWAAAAHLCWLNFLYWHIHSCLYLFPEIQTLFPTFEQCVSTKSRLLSKTAIIDDSVFKKHGILTIESIVQGCTRSACMLILTSSRAPLSIKKSMLYVLLS